MKPSRFHNAVKPIQWLIGQWKTTSGIVTYPTLECPKKYQAVMTFTCWGQPMLNYTSFAWDSKSGIPIYSETGFLLISRDHNLISLISCQNYGMATTEEGNLTRQSIEVATKYMHCIGTAKDVEHIVNASARNYTLTKDGKLEYKMKVAVQGFPLTPHLQALYEKDV